LEKGLQVKLYDDIVFEHMRPRGTEHQFVYWGAAMGTLGYHPLYATGRIAKNALLRLVTVKGSMNVFRGYLQAQLGSDDSFISPFDPSLQQFVSREQAHRIARLVKLSL